MRQAILYSFALCAISVGLEALFAGGGIRKRMAELRKPRFVPPLWGWAVIGLFYYVMFFGILYRLFSLPVRGPRAAFAITAALVMMLINAAWNFFFFRTRNLLHAYLIGLPYTVVALVLFALLFSLDRPAAWLLAPYILYLAYANAWSRALMKLNPR